MKIFLNDRCILFIPHRPESLLPSELLVEFQSAGKLQEDWEDFKRYEKYRKFLIVDPDFNEHNPSGAFAAFRSFFKFIPAAGGLVKNEKEEFLFIHRLGYWDLPKGKIDHMDIQGPGNTKTDLSSASAAAVREVKEETGLKTIAIRRELPATWHIYLTREKWILKQTRWFEMEADSGQKLVPETSEGIFLVKWTPPEGIHCILTHTYASLRELLLEVLF